MSQVNYTQPLQNIINEYRSKSPTELESLIGKDNHFEFSENDKNYQIEVRWKGLMKRPDERADEKAWPWKTLFSYII